MRSSTSRLGITSTLVAFASFLSVAAVAQSPAYIMKWGSYGNGNGQFFSPQGVATDADGYVYLADLNNHRIQKFNRVGFYVTQWGSFGYSGNGQFQSPWGVATNAAGEVYVVDSKFVQKFTSSGTFLTQWEVPGNDYQLSGVAVDQAGNVFVVVTASNLIVKFTGSGTLLTQWGSAGQGNGKFDHPTAIAVDGAGNVYVSDTQNHRIQKFTSTGTFLTKWGAFGSGNGKFYAPDGVASDASGDVYVVDGGNNRVQKFTAGGTYLAQWGAFGAGDGQFEDPRGIAIDLGNHVFVTEETNHRVQKFGSPVLDVPTSAIDAPLVLEPIRPNPVLGMARFAFTLAREAEVTLAIYDVSGREAARLVHGQRLAPGSHAVRFDGSGLPSGLYVCVLRASRGLVATRRMVVTR